MGRERALGRSSPRPTSRAIQAALAATRARAAWLWARSGPRPGTSSPTCGPPSSGRAPRGRCVDGARAGRADPPPRGGGPAAPATAAASRPWRPSWAALLGGLPAVGPLRELRRALDDDGAVRDEASSALRRLRARLRELRRDARQAARGLLPAARARTRLFQERYVTVRHGRYVLPVLAGAKGRAPRHRPRPQPERRHALRGAGVGGRGQQRAGPGRRARRRREVLRVLAALTDAVRAGPARARARWSTASARLDLVFARAELAERMDAVEPVVADERVVDVRGRAPSRCSSPRAGSSRPIGPARAGGAGGSPPRRRAPAPRHHRAQCGRQDGGAQDARASSR